MTGVEVAAVSGLWVVLFVLAALVLVLYRQVEKAYRYSAGVADSALRPGSVVPDVAVVREGVIQPVPYPERELSFVVFVTSTCSSCRDLMQRLDSSEGVGPRVVALVTGDGFQEYSEPRNQRMATYWVSSPADVHDQFGVNLVPMVYVIRDRTVLGATHDSSDSGLRALLAQVEAASTRLNVNGQGLSLELHGS